MNLLLNSDWQFGELFTRFSSIFSWGIGEGSSLVFTKLDFWLFFLLVMAVFSFLNKHILTRSIFLTVISLFFFYKTSDNKCGLQLLSGKEDLHSRKIDQ